MSLKICNQIHKTKRGNKKKLKVPNLKIKDFFFLKMLYVPYCIQQQPKKKIKILFDLTRCINWRQNGVKNNFSLVFIKAQFLNIILFCAILKVANMRKNWVN